MKTTKLPNDYLNSKKESFIENNYTWMWLEDGIVYCVYKPKLVITLDVAKKILNDRLKISQGITRPALLDARNFRYIERVGLRYYKTKEAIQYINATAFLVDTFFLQFFYNVFIDLKKPLIPTKLFKEKDKALEWLEPYKHIG